MNPIFTKLIEAAKRIQALPVMQSHKEELQKIQSNIETAAKQPQTILICGECKRGKSTFINEWLGDEVCPVDLDICTAVVTIIKYGENRKAIRYYGNIDQLNKQEGLQKEEFDFAKLEDNISAQLLPPDTWIVEIELPNDKLKNGLVLIDTPGVGGLTATHGFLTNTFIQRADMVLFAIDTLSPITKTELDFYKENILPSKITTSFLLNKCDLTPDYKPLLEDLRAKVTSVSDTTPVNVFPVSVFEKKGLDVIEKTIPRHELQRARIYKQQLMQELQNELQAQELIQSQEQNTNLAEQQRLNQLLNDLAQQIQEWSNPMSTQRLAIQNTFEHERNKVLTQLSNDFTTLLGTRLRTLARDTASNHANDKEWLVKQIQTELDDISKRLVNNIAHTADIIAQVPELQSVFHFQAQGISPIIEHKFSTESNVQFSQKIAPFMQGAGIATMLSFWLTPWVGIPAGIIAIIGGAAGGAVAAMTTQLQQELTPKLQNISQQMSSSAQLTYNDMNQEIFLTINSILSNLKKQAETTKQTLVSMHNDATKFQQLKAQAQAAIMSLKTQIQMLAPVA